MAQKRMFDKRITDSDKFTDLPNSTKALYFMAGMCADDRGFFQPRRLQKLCGFSDDDFKVLIAKRYFISFESGVMVITDWNKNNYLDKNRITETEYIDELNLLKIINEKYEINDTCLTNVKPMLNQYSIEENSIEENSICNRASLIDFLEENGFELTPIQMDVVNTWNNDDLTRHAIEEAVKNNKYNINYINKILYTYQKENITTVEQAIERENNFRNKKNNKVPNWFNEVMDVESTTEDEQKELEDLLNELQQ